MKSLTKPLLLCLAFALATAPCLPAQQDPAAAPDPFLRAPGAQPEVDPFAPRGGSRLPSPTLPEPAVADPFASGGRTTGLPPRAAPITGGTGGAVGFGGAGGGGGQIPVREALLRLEMFSLSPKAARKALIQFPSEAELYTWTSQQSDKEETGGVTFERVEVLRVRDGQRSKVESIDEFPYPTEFDPPQLIQNLGLGVPAAAAVTNNNTVTPPPPVPQPKPAPSPESGAGGGAQGDPGPQGHAVSVALGGFSPDILKTPVTPQSFEYKNLGVSVEAELVFHGDGSSAELNIAPNRTKLLGEIPRDLAGGIIQPIFSSQTIATQLTVREGVPALLGTFNPAARTGVKEGTEEERTWFLFLTMTVPQ